MKITLFVVGTLAASNLWASVSQAAPAPGRKLPGPSAVEAARLKNSPPPGYLSHYLPDDRYKIAGGVWKYVSTDLDTYYHIPTSPNMMRQPASRVIGFANARDAEEAGYVADPTDGTANRAAPTTPPSDAVGKLSAEDERYKAQIAPLMSQFSKDAQTFLAKMSNAQQQRTGITPEFRQAITDQLRQSGRFLKQLNAIHPPAHLRKFQSLLLQGFRASSNTVVAFNQMVTTGDISQLRQIQSQLVSALMLQRDIMEEGAKQGIYPKQPR